MKKIILLSILLASLMSLNAQTPSGYSEPIAILKVDTNFHSKGANIDGPFYFNISSLTMEIDTALGFIMYAHTYTSIDSLGVNKFVNDSIPNLKIYTVSQSIMDTSTLFDKVKICIKEDMINFYTEPKVTNFK